MYIELLIFKTDIHNSKTRIEILTHSRSFLTSLREKKILAHSRVQKTNF